MVCNNLNMLLTIFFFATIFLRGWDYRPYCTPNTFRQSNIRQFINISSPLTCYQFYTFLQVLCMLFRYRSNVAQHLKDTEGVIFKIVTKLLVAVHVDFINTVLIRMYIHWCYSCRTVFVFLLQQCITVTVFHTNALLILCLCLGMYMNLQLLHTLSFIPQLYSLV